MLAAHARMLSLTFTNIHPHANPDTRNRTRDHLIAAQIYSQMLYQLSYVRLVIGSIAIYVE